MASPSNSISPEKYLPSLKIIILIIEGSRERGRNFCQTADGKWTGGGIARFFFSSTFLSSKILIRRIARHVGPDMDVSLREWNLDSLFTQCRENTEIKITADLQVTDFSHIDPYQEFEID